MERRTEDGWRLSRTLSLDGFVSIAVVVLSACALYLHQQARISAVADEQTQVIELIKEMKPVLQKLDKRSDALQDRMRDFPLHRHVGKNGTIVYPNGVRFDGDPIEAPQSLLLHPEEIAPGIPGHGSAKNH